MSEASERSRTGPKTASEVRPRALVVVGMHRSGTSAVARLLNLLGADLPHNLIQPLKGDNEPGFWEGRDIAEAHDALLEAAGSSWHDVAPRAESWFDSTAARELEDLLLEILERHFTGSTLFAIKDPRICRLVPLWLRVLERFGADCSFILTIRNPLEVASSLEARDGFSLAKSLVLWLRHVLEAERHTRGHPRSWAFYPSLLGEWRSVVDRLEDDLDLAWAPLAPETEAEIEDFLSERHRHHTFSQGDLEVRPEVVEWVKRAYAAATRAHQAPETLTETFNDISRELAVADRAFGPLLAEASPELHEIAHRHAAEIETLRDELERRDREFAKARLEVGQLSGKLERSEGRAQRARAELEKVQGFLTAVLSSRLFRYTRPLRRVWYRLKRGPVG